MTEALRRTPLYEEHRALGGRIVPFAGYELPVQYAGVVKEHGAVRERAGIFDVSHMGEMRLEGPRALEVVDALVTNDVTKLADGRAMYTVACNERGTILDDLIVYRESAEQILVVCNASNREKMVSHFEQFAAPRCRFEDASERTALLAVQGPQAIAICGAAGASAAITNLPSFGLANGEIGGVRCTAARTGYTGEDGLEIFCDAGDAVRLFRALLEAGRPMGLEPCGLGARDTLRLEARLSLYGNEIDETTDPFEAGLGWVVKLDGRDFLGRTALVETKANPSPRRLVGFEMVGRGIARHGYPIVSDTGAEIGVVTSGSPAPSLDKNIGLGYVPTEMTAIGTPLGVDVRGKRVEAIVVKTPFYKRQK